MKTLGDFVTLQRGNTYKSALLGQPGPVLLGLGSIARNGGFKGDNLKTYGGTSDPRMLLGPGDIYVSLKDVTQAADLLGAVARVPQRVEQGRLTQDTVKLSFTASDAPKDYLYWLLQTPDYRAYCRAHSTGTTNLGLAREDFLAFSVPELTPIRQQIVEAVQLAEDKAELNRRMNETLEAMAQAIFRDWFVDFGPVRRKLDGATDPVAIMGGLTPDPARAAELAAMFPAALGEDGLPEGWRRLAFMAVAKLISGGTPKTDRADYWNGTLPWASAKDVSQCGEAFLLHTERTITPLGLRESSTKIVPKFATAVVARGATTGRFCMFGDDFAMNQTCYALESRDGAPFWLNRAFANLVQELVQGAHGSVFDTITTRTFEAASTVVPSSDLMLMFEELAGPLFQRALAASTENRTLAEARDYLLPRLMSGTVIAGEKTTRLGEVA